MIMNSNFSYNPNIPRFMKKRLINYITNTMNTTGIYLYDKTIPRNQNILYFPNLIKNIHYDFKIINTVFTEAKHRERFHQFDVWQHSVNIHNYVFVEFSCIFQLAINLKKTMIIGNYFAENI